MRHVVLILIFSPSLLFGQFKNEWRALPNVKSTDAVINKRAAVIDTIIAKEKTPKIQEIHNAASLEFISVVFPDTLEKISWKAHPLYWSKRVQIPNGFIYKDVASHNIKYLDKPHGLPDNGIRSIAEDSDGLIYLASGSGLLVYNGYEITVFEDLPYFSFTNSKSLYYDKDDKMWIATNQQIGYIQDNELYLPERPIFGGVHQQPFREDHNGDFYISTNYNGLFILKQDYILHYEKNLPHNMIADAILTKENKLWFAFARHGLGFILNDSLYAYKEFGESNTSRAFVEREGELWIGNFGAPILKYRNDSLFTIQLNTPTNYVYTLEQNAKGVWFSDYSKGVFLIKPNGEYYRFYDTNGLSSNGSYDLYIDSFENVWVAHLANGLSRIDENLFFKVESNTHSNKIQQTKQDQNGNSWYFRNGALLTEETGDNYILYRNKPDSKFVLHAHCINGFVRKDEVWMGSYDMGIIRLKNMEYTYHQIDEKGSGDNSILNLEDDGHGGIWAISTENHLYHFHENRFYNFSDSKKFEEFDFVTLKKVRTGEIFVTTKENGVIQIQRDQYRKIELLESPNTNQIHHIYKDLSGDLWFFMNNEIQMVKADGNITKIEDPIFRNNHVRDLVEIERDNFLGVTGDGIISIRKNSSGIEMNLIGSDYGLYMVENISLNKNSSGKTFISRHDGIITLDSVFLNKKSSPKLSFNRFEVDGDTLSAIDNRFSVEQGIQIRAVFNKIYWGNKSSLHYKLSHNNSTANWNEQTSNSITFQELAHGNYTLSVFAKGDELLSEEVNVQFRILPYWYQTTWAKVLFAVLILGSIIAYFLNRERKARVIKLQLEGLVAEKTSELASQLEQKEILVQEVHHRVKNNLTFLKSLLYLRSKASENDDVKIILDECQARIQSMALVHQNLYDVDDASQVDFAYFLRELFTELEIMFDQTDLKLNLDTNDQKLDMKLSVFLGLILNELITNTIKYAYNGKVDKQVFIAFQSTGDNYTLSYSDNGQGLPSDFDIASTSGFGFKLIRILLDQIDAEISYNRNNLSTFTILIPR